MLGSLQHKKDKQHVFCPKNMMIKQMMLYSLHLSEKVEM